MRSYSLAGPAQKDLRDIRAYIARDNPDAAAAFIARLTDKFQRLAASPGIGQRREDLGPGLLTFPVGLHIILYRVCPSGVEIARVTRGARNLQALLRRG